MTEGVVVSFICASAMTDEGVVILFTCTLMEGVE